MIIAFAGCALNDSDMSGIPGMKVWLDASEGVSKPTGYVTSWENQADPNHNFTATSSTAVSYSSNNFGYPITNPGLYFNSTPYPMQSPIVLDDATFTVGFAGQTSDPTYELLVIPTKKWGDIGIRWNSDGYDYCLQVYCMGSQYPLTNSYSASSSVPFFIIRFTETPAYLNVYEVNSTGPTPYQVNIPFNSGYNPSPYMSVGRCISTISDVLIFDYALSDSEIDDVESIVRKKYGF